MLNQSLQNSKQHLPNKSTHQKKRQNTNEKNHTSWRASGGLLSPKRYLKKASRWRPFLWRSEDAALMIDCASSLVALSCFWTSIRNLWRWSTVMTPFSEYFSKRVLTSRGASDAVYRNLRLKQKHTLYVCFDMRGKRKRWILWRRRRWKQVKIILFSCDI